MKFLSLLLIIFTALTYAQEPQDLNQTEEFKRRIHPLVSLMYENSLGPSFTMGYSYNYKDDPQPFPSSFTGPYVEMGLGTHGANVDIGVMEGSDFATSAAISLSYLKVFNHTGFYPLGDYYGINTRVSNLFVILKFGMYLNPVTNSKKVNIGIGVGF